MKCPVCYVSWGGESPKCPQCSFDQSAPGAGDTDAILKARDAFKQQALAYNPDSRVSLFDKLRPWLSLLLGFILLIFWLRACSTMGWRLW
jgi:hypothetical protein